MLQELHIQPMSALFHEESAAIDAYRKAMAVHRNTDIAAKLREMFVNHREAAGLLRRHVPSPSPRTEPCPWQAVLEIQGEDAGRLVLEALKTAEACARDLYARTLKQVGLPPGGRSLIAAILLPQVERNLVALDRMLV